MKGSSLIIAFLVIVIVVLCAVIAGGFLSMNGDGSSADLSQKVSQKVSQSVDDGSSSGSKIIDGLEKVSNGQAGDGSYFYEKTYDDGNVRQYDENGNLIGSTFDEDQAQLGNPNGDLE